MNDTEKRANNGATPEQMRGGRTYVPAVDILEQNDELLVLADIPGARPEAIDINYERGELTIRAAVAPRQQPSDFALREYGVGDFVRTFRIGEGIDAQRINAEVANGVLTLHLPKAEAAKSRKIAVKGA